MVRELAGQLPDELTCVVTGDPAPRLVVNDALMYAIKGSVHLNKGQDLPARRTALARQPASRSADDFDRTVVVGRPGSPTGPSTQCE